MPQISETVERRTAMRVIYDDVVEFAEVAIRCEKTASKGKCVWCPFYDRCQVAEFENRHVLCATVEPPKPPKET